MANPAYGLRLAGKIKICEMVHEFRGGSGGGGEYGATALE